MSIYEFIEKYDFSFSKEVIDYGPMSSRSHIAYALYVNDKASIYLYSETNYCIYPHHTPLSFSIDEYVSHLGSIQTAPKL